MAEFLRDLVENNIDPDDQIFNYLCKVDVKRIQSLLRRLDLIRAFDATSVARARTKQHKYPTKASTQAQRSRLLGKTLETLMLSMLRGCRGIEIGANLRSTTSEIDFMVQVNTLAFAIPFFKDAAPHLIGEAKCYTTGFKSEWVNELVGLMNVHNTKHSIIFTACPSKNLRTDHRQLLQIHNARGDRVIPFGLAQVTQIANGANFLKVLSNQYVKVLNSTTDLTI